MKSKRIINKRFDKKIALRILNASKTSCSLFRKYARKYKTSKQYEESSDDERHEFNCYWGEAHERLTHCELILKKIIAFDRSYTFSITSTALGREKIALVRLLTEAFYYQSFRVYNIFKTKSLPQTSRFECVGIREVRNDIIEHPKEVLPYSFGFGGLGGPCLKYGIKGNKPFSDKGLYINAEEFYNSLNKKLEEVLKGL